MKYARKIVALLIAAVVLASVAIGVGVIFAVKNVNVTLLSYSAESGSGEAEERIAAVKKDVLASIRGTVIAFVSEDTVAAAVSGQYTVTDVEKIYPCTVNVTVKERREMFAVANGFGYAVYDEDGVFLAYAENALNAADGAPDLILEGTDSTEDIVALAGVCASFRQAFGCLRSVAGAVVLEKAENALQVDKVIFRLHCGVSVELQEYAVSTVEKLAAAYAAFVSLSGEQKLEGTIYCYETAEMGVNATYSRAY